MPIASSTINLAHTQEKKASKANKAKRFQGFFQLFNQTMAKK